MRIDSVHCAVWKSGEELGNDTEATGRQCEVAVLTAAGSVYARMNWPQTRHPQIPLDCRCRICGMRGLYHRPSGWRHGVVVWQRSLEKRINRSSLLFADEMISRELAVRLDYFQGK